LKPERAIKPYFAKKNKERDEKMFLKNIEKLEESFEKSSQKSHSKVTHQ
jgi:hypothetical protein